jgi:hypothetical protein
MLTRDLFAQPLSTEQLLEACKAAMYGGHSFYAANTSSNGGPNKIHEWGKIK